MAQNNVENPQNARELREARRNMYIAGTAMFLFGTFALLEGLAAIAEFPVETIPLVGQVLGGFNALVEGGAVTLTLAAAGIFKDSRRKVLEMTGKTPPPSKPRPPSGNLFLRR